VGEYYGVESNDLTLKHKPNCSKCHKPYLRGGDQVCDACRRGKPRRALRCLCRQRATLVILAAVYTPEGEQREIELALCQTCYQWEREMEEELKVRKPPFQGVNPVKVIEVTSLPRVKRPLKGRKLG
jgi:hypothetical protein